MSDNGSEIVRRLDILIRLIAVAIAEEDWPQRKKIAMLASAGLNTREIADFLGTTPNTVSVAVSNLRKEKRTKLGRPLTREATNDE